MKTIFLLRHVSAIQFNKDVEDHQKEINEKGKLHANLISKWIEDNNFSIDIVFSSTAKRAKQTTNIIFEKMKTVVHFKKELYLCTYIEIIEELKAIEKDLVNVLVVGHEPSMSETLKFLVGDKTRPDLNNKINEPYPTGGLAIINLNIEKWSDIVEKKGILDAFLAPEELI